MPLLNDIFIKALKLLNAPDGSLALLDRDKNELVFVLVLGDLSDELTGFRMPADEGIAGWVIENAQPTLVRDVRRDTRFFANVDEQFKFQTQSVLAAPLIGDGHVLGMIEALNQPGDQPFSELDLALLKLICRIAGEELANIERRPVGDA
jgi:sigma-B regulation protein RsbU (phosphoserine phosphatase)